MQTEQHNTPEAAPLVQLSIPTPAGDAQSDAAKTVTVANCFAIFDAEDSVEAQEFRAQINTRIKTLTDARLALTRPIDAAKKTIMDFFNGPINQLEFAKRTMDAKVIEFDNEQERIRREAQRKVEAEAAKERARLQAIADESARKARQEADAKRKAAEEAAAAGRAEEAARLNAQAERTEERAAAKVEQFEMRAATVVAPIIQANSAKASGSSFRDNWKFEITDPSKVSEAFMMRVPNEVAIAALVKSMHDGAASLVGPGVRIYNERILASRRA